MGSIDGLADSNLRPLSNFEQKSGFPVCQNTFDLREERAAPGGVQLLLGFFAASEPSPEAISLKAWGDLLFRTPGDASNDDTGVELSSLSFERPEWNPNPHRMRE